MSDDDIPAFLRREQPKPQTALDSLPVFGEVAKFKPQEAKANLVKADAVLTAARELKDWPTLAVAVARVMELQTDVDEWWTRKVSVRESPGRSGNKSSADQRSISVADAEKLLKIAHQQISKWRRRLKEPEKYREMLFGAAYFKAMAETNNTTATKWTGDPESYTPAKFIEAARQCMAGIDLDPASNALAQKTVNAAKWYDESENGLLQNWTGRVFLNPPYTHPTVAHFIDKLCQEFVAGNVTAAVLLTNNNTDTKWWHQAAAFAGAVCFTAGRINFYKADGSETQPTNGQTFFYFGTDVEAFAFAFGEHGLIMATLDG